MDSEEDGLLLFTLEICKKYLPLETNPIHFERLRKIERILQDEPEAKRQQTLAPTASEQIMLHAFRQVGLSYSPEAVLNVLSLREIEKGKGKLTKSYWVLSEAYTAVTRLREHTFLSKFGQQKTASANGGEE